MNDCVHVPNKMACPTDPVTPQPRVCKPFEVCVGNSTLAYDGECITLQPRSYQIPDGTYGSITFTGGCVTGVGEAPVAAYTPNACCGPAGATLGPAPGGAVAVSPQACNWLTNGPAGLMVAPTIQPGDGVEVKGCGTPADPLRISVPRSTGGVHVGEGDSPIRVQGNGEQTSPLIIGMNSSGVNPGTYRGFDVDKYGRVTKYTAAEGSGVQALIDGEITASETPEGSGVYLLALKTVVPPTTLTFGKYAISVSSSGRIVGLKVLPESASLVAGSFYAPPAPDGRVGAKIISYDANGVILRAEPYTAGGGALVDIPAGP